MNVAVYPLGVFSIGMKYQIHIAKHGEMENLSAISCTKLLLYHQEIYSILEKAMFKDLDKVNLRYFLAPDI